MRLGGCTQRGSGACRPQGKEEGLTRTPTGDFILCSEDVSLALEEHSDAALRRLPRAVAEIGRMEADSLALGGTVDTVLDTLQAAEAASSASVSTLASLDASRRRLEKARGMLQEAAGLADLLERSSSVLATGDVRSLADALMSMRRALTVVGAAPEFAAGAARVAALEEALEQALCPALVSAVEAHDSARSAELADMLSSAGREGAVEKAYTAARGGQWVQLWETQVASADGQGGAQALVQHLGGFYDALVNAAGAEQRWAASALGKHDHTGFVLALILDLASRTAKPLGQRLTQVLGPPGQGGSSSGTASLPALCALHDTVAVCVRSLARLFAGGPAVKVLPVLDALLRPWEPWVGGYGELERRHVTALLAQLDVKDGGGLLPVARRLFASVAGAQDILDGCAPRCARLTGGCEADQLLRAVDDAALSYITTCQALLRRQRAALGLPGEEGDAAAAAGAALSDDTLHAAVELLPLGRAVLAAMAHTEACLREALQDAATRLAPALPPGDADGAAADTPPAPAAAATIPARAAAVLASADAAAIRLAAAPPERGRKLRALLAAAHQPRFASLPHAGPRAGLLAEAVHDFVHDCLLARVRLSVEGLSGRPHWAAGDPSSEAGLPLPMFSASPGEYVTSLGEYLLTLPQLLEALDAPGGGGEGGEADEPPPGGAQNGDDDDAAAAAAGGGATGLAAAWLGRVASSAGDVMTGELVAIRALTPRGAAQLEADADYLCNVLAALSVAPPSGLATLRALAGCRHDELAQAVVQHAQRPAAASFVLDTAVADALMRMRTAGNQVLLASEQHDGGQ